MLRKELNESDIPGRTTIRKRVEEIFEEHLCELQRDMNVCPFAFAFLNKLDC